MESGLIFELSLYNKTDHGRLYAPWRLTISTKMTWNLRCVLLYELF